MKNIKFLSVIILQLLFLQLAIAQPGNGINDNNGRENGTAPIAIDNSADDVPVTNNTPAGIDDADIPGSYSNGSGPQTQWVIPSDLDALTDEYNFSGNLEANARLDKMEAQLKDLVRFNEQLRLENLSIKKSLASCCSGNLLDNSAAYLLQNTPNPFNQTSEVHFFVPEGVKNARLDVRSVEGNLIESYAIKTSGFGKLDFKANTLASGSYVYMLCIGEEIIDSKVMILTR